MKKGILLAACFSLFAAGVVITSCKKDKEWKGCTCKFVYSGERGTETYSAAELKEEGISSCAELQKAESEYFESITCSDL